MNPRRVNAKGARWNAARALDVLFVLVCAALLLPFFRHVDFFDSDAYGMAGYVRQTGGRFSGLVNANAYTFISMAMWAVNGMVNLTGRAWNDYLLDYRLVIYLASLGLLGCTYAMLLALTRRRAVAFVFGLLLALLPGVQDLSVIGEDNLFSSAMHMQYALACLLFVAAWSRGSGAARRRRGALAWLLPLSLLAAVLSHREHGVLWVTPLALPWLTHRGRDRRMWLLTGRIYLTALAGFLGMFAFFAWWGGQPLRWPLYRDMLHDWLLPNAYYRQYYFFQADGWSWLAQGRRIMTGAGRLLSHTPFLGTPFMALYIGLPVLLVLGSLGRGSRARRIWGVPLLLALIHVPHSLIYESDNLERWDIIAPPLTVLAGVLALQLHRRAGIRTAGGRRWSAAWLLGPIVLGIGVHNLAYRHELLERLDRRTREPDRSELIATLRSAVSAEARQWDRPPVLVLAREEYNPNPMLPAAYCSWLDAIYLLRRNGEIEQPDGLYPGLATLRRVARETFFARITDRRVIATSRGREWIESLRGGRIADETHPGTATDAGTGLVLPASRFLGGDLP